MDEGNSIWSLFYAPLYKVHYNHLQFFFLASKNHCTPRRRQLSKLYTNGYHNQRQQSSESYSGVAWSTWSYLEGTTGISGKQYMFFFTSVPIYICICTCIYRITNILICKYWTENILIQENMILNNTNLLQHVILNVNLILYVYMFEQCILYPNVSFSKRLQISPSEEKEFFKFYAIWSIFKTQLSVK